MMTFVSASIWGEETRPFYVVDIPYQLSMSCYTAWTAQVFNELKSESPERNKRACDPQGSSKLIRIGQLQQQIYSPFCDPRRAIEETNQEKMFRSTLDSRKKPLESLKQTMAEAGTLAYFDKSTSTKVIEDVSPVGLGAVLIQNQNGAWAPICYASRSLTECERKYSQMEKEVLALVWACEMYHFRITQAEGVEWKKELRRYVTKYRSIDHTTTGKSPAELLFNR